MLLVNRRATDSSILGQGRLDGAFCEYKEEDKLEFLKRIQEENVVNMEMESLCFAALCNHAGIRGAVICVTLLNRLKGDQVSDGITSGYSLTPFSLTYQ